MIENVSIAPSILSADLTRLGAEIESVASADFVHIDVMDGHFVPNLSFGAPIVAAAKRATSLPLDVHIMVTNPQATAHLYLDAGADWLTFHIEACDLGHRLCAQIREAGAHPAVALNPSTPVAAVEEIICAVDMVLVMSVDPGFGGQAFIPSMLGKLRSLAALRDRVNPGCLIEVDGGIGAANAEEVVAAGADVLVAGSSVFNAPDRAAAIAALRAAGQRGKGMLA